LERSDRNFEELPVLLIKTTILSGTLIAALMCMFPPYTGQAVSPRKALDLPAGYYYVFDPPKGDRFNSGRSEFVISYELNSKQLYGQLFLVGYKESAKKWRRFFSTAYRVRARHE